mmetsp:Transcript_39674/g.61919  ORF Transcript_39674/g.61919 Transcript_39674/m.61919 type:complete len:134 (+) Transcript_39674:673-1074(+)
MGCVAPTMEVVAPWTVSSANTFIIPFQRSPATQGLKRTDKLPSCKSESSQSPTAMLNTQRVPITGIAFMLLQMSLHRAQNSVQAPGFVNSARPFFAFNDTKPTALLLPSNKSRVGSNRNNVGSSETPLELTSK